MNKRHRWVVLTALFAAINVCGYFALYFLLRDEVRDLKVRTITPKGEFKTSDVVTIAFNQVMTSPDRIGTEVPAEFITLSPYVAGAFEWNSTHSMIFKPMEELPKGRRFAITVSGTISDLTGVALGKAVKHEFTTEPLKIIDVSQANMLMHGNVALVVDFNDAVNELDLKKRLDVKLASGTSISYSLASINHGRRYAVTTSSMNTIEPITVTIEKGLVATGKEIGLVNSFKKKITVTSKLNIWGAGTGYTFKQAVNKIRIRTNQRVDTKTLRDYVEISPSVSFSVSPYYGGFHVHGRFKPATIYTITCLKGLSTETGIKLPADKSFRITTPDYDRSFEIRTTGRYMMGQGGHRIPLRTVNVRTLRVTVERIFSNNVFFALKRGLHRLDRDLGKKLFETTIATTGPVNTTVDVEFDLKDAFDGKRPDYGVYVLKVVDPLEEWRGKSQVIMVTDLGIHVRRTMDDLLIRVASLKSGTPAANVKVSVISDKNQIILQACTNDDGMVLLPKTKLTETPYLLLAESGADMTFLEFPGTAVDMSEFDVTGRAVHGDYDCFVYGDRGIYRPGESVHVQAMVRQANLDGAPPFPLILRIKRPDGTMATSFSGMPDAFGLFCRRYSTQRDAMLGTYRAELSIPGEKTTIGSWEFHVEEFIPDRMKVEFHGLPTIDVAMGTTMNVVVGGSFHTGQPAVGRRAKVSATFTQVPFTPKRYSSYHFGGGPTMVDKTIILGEGELDDDGKLTCPLMIPEDLKANGKIDVRLNVTVNELGGRAVSARERVGVNALPIFLGIKRPNVVTPDRPCRFDVVTVAPDGTVFTEKRTIVATLYAVERNWVMKRVDEKWRWICNRTETLVNTFEIPCTEGSGTLTWTPKRYGAYKLAVTDVASSSLTEITFDSWGGRHTTSSGKPGVLKLSATKESYDPGEMAEVTVELPFDGWLLMTLESSRIHWHKHLRVTGKSQRVSIPIPAECVPNAYICATLFRPMTIIGMGTWRSAGVLPIAVSKPGLGLKTSIDVPETCRPGSKIPINLRVAYESGMPAKCRVTLAAVDEGILGLTDFESPDPIAFFTSKRRLPTTWNDVYGLLMPETEPVDHKQSVVGGGDAVVRRRNPIMSKRALINPIVADRVKSAVLFVRDLETDENGAIATTVNVPEFSGSLRWMVVASAMNGVGRANAQTIVSEPLEVRPTFPRFLACNDEFVIPVQVFNQTGAGGAVSVTLTAPGLILQTPHELTLSIADAREGAFAFKVKAPNVPQAVTATLVATLGSETTTKTITLPVRPAAAPKVVSEAGILKAGQVHRIKVPTQVVKGTGNYHLVVSGEPGLQLGSALTYLLKYPYGCLEQTTSSTMPLIRLPELGRSVDPKRFGKDRVRSYVQAGISRVLSMQQFDGSFGWWCSSSGTYDWGSIYATHMLVEARNAGYAVNKESYDRALEFMTVILGRDLKNDYKAYACFVLAKAGKAPRSWILRLYECRERMPFSAHCHLAVGLSKIGKMKEARALLRRFIPTKDRKTELTGTLFSSIREQAIYLDTLLEIDPEHKEIHRIAQRVSDNLSTTGWYSTQNNAFVALSLGRYLRTFTKDRQVTGWIRRDGKSDVAITHADTVKMAIDSDAESEIVIDLHGKGNLFYLMTGTAVPLVPDPTEVSHGIAIDRRLLDKDGNLLGSNVVTQGDLVVVEIRMAAERNVPNLVVNDLLPAGLEIENEKLMTREGLPWLRKNAVTVDNVEKRDDRLLLFCSLQGDKKWHCFRYATRAVTQGRFTAPGINGFCMYDGSIVSRRKSSTVIVGPRPIQKLVGVNE